MCVNVFATRNRDFLVARWNTFLRIERSEAIEIGILRKPNERRRSAHGFVKTQFQFFREKCNRKKETFPRSSIENVANTGLKFQVDRVSSFREKLLAGL